MEFLLFLYGLIAFSILAYAISWARCYYRLRHFDGPPLSSTDLFMARAATSGRVSEIYKEVCNKYGSLARIGPKTLITDDPELIKRMSAARSPYSRSGYYTSLRMHPRLHNMFSTRNKDVHDDIKAKTANGYNGRDIPNLEADIDEQIIVLQDTIRRKYITTSTEYRPANFADLSVFLTLDIITKIAYGKAMGWLATDSDLFSLNKVMYDALPLMELLGHVEWLGAIFGTPWFLTLFGPKATDIDGMGRLMRLAQKLVDGRFSLEANDYKDMLGSFIRHGLEKKQCEGEILLQVTAGAETTATATKVIVLHVATAPHVYKTLQEEIDLGIADGKISSPVTNAEAKKLPYLQAVIMEGIRIIPPVPSIFTKQLYGAKDDYFQGQRIPAGTKIAQASWSMMHRQDIFGEDSHIFRPERWLEASPEKRAQMEDVVNLNWGYGRWGCPGKNIAWIELNKVFVELFREFNFQIVNPTKPWIGANFVSYNITDMWVKITLRSEETKTGGRVEP